MFLCSGVLGGKFAIIVFEDSTALQAWYGLAWDSLWVKMTSDHLPVWQLEKTLVMFAQLHVE